MDPYDLPQELSMLQCQDMAKIGFVQDLLRGIKKVLEKPSGDTAAPPIAGLSQEGQSEVAALLKRAFIVLEDEDWVKADGLLEQVLNRDPENARAYIGKLLAKLKVTDESALPKAAAIADIQSLADFGEYKRALRYADAEYKRVLEGYEPTRKEYLYLMAIDAMNTLKSSNPESDFKFIIGQFNSISGYKDSDAFAEKCRQKLIQSKRDGVIGGICGCVALLALLAIIIAVIYYSC
jgi:hypothetical protein